MAFAELRAEHFCRMDLASRLARGEPAGVATYATIEAVCEESEATVLRARLRTVGKSACSKETARSEELMVPDHDSILGKDR